MLRQPQAFPFSARCLPLACLDRTGMENWLRSWQGASGRRYICSVHAIGEPPTFDLERAIVAAVRKGELGESIIFVFQPGFEAESDAFPQWTEKAHQLGAQEWHVHLLAESPEQREFALSDLAPKELVLAA